MQPRIFLKTVLATHSKAWLPPDVSRSVGTVRAVGKVRLWGGGKGVPLGGNRSFSLDSTPVKLLKYRESKKRNTWTCIKIETV